MLPSGFRYSTRYLPLGGMPRSTPFVIDWCRLSVRHVTIWIPIRPVSIVTSIRLTTEAESSFFGWTVIACMPLTSQITGRKRDPSLCRIGLSTRNPPRDCIVCQDSPCEVMIAMQEAHSVTTVPHASAFNFGIIRFHAEGAGRCRCCRMPAASWRGSAASSRLSTWNQRKAMLPPGSHGRCLKSESKARRRSR